MPQRQEFSTLCQGRSFHCKWATRGLPDDSGWPAQEPRLHTLPRQPGDTCKGTGTREPAHSGTLSNSRQVRDPLQGHGCPGPRLLARCQAEGQAGDADIRPPPAAPELADQTKSTRTSYSTMAFFILSTSKIILMSSCTGLGSLDLVPGFTVSFLTASSSFREKKPGQRARSTTQAKWWWHLGHR